MIRRTIYFVAGEVSGDNHGGALMASLRQLQPNLQFIGRGGPQMKTIAGEQFHNWIDHAAVVGLWEVIKNYGYFRKKFRETLSEIEQTKPDAVVLDISMPAGDGFTVAERIQANIPTPTPIIFLTASRRPDFRQRARQLGAVGFFEKPYEPEDLLAAVRNAVA